MVLATLFTLAMRPSRELAATEAQQPKILSEAIAAYQSAGGDGLRNYSRTLRDSQHLHIFLFDGQGQDLTGRQPPDWIVKIALGQTLTADTIWGRLLDRRFLRLPGTSADGHSFTLVTELPLPKHALFGPNGNPLLAIAIGLVSSGLICFLLARYLTSPIVRLRAATQQLAAGDLAARAGTSTNKGHDDISQLVRDFDRMAERLETLVDAQSRLLKDISHELRSPLARLNVALELARQRSGPEAQTSIDRMEREASRLNELIGRLLTLSRLEANNGVIPRLPVHLGELVEEITSDAAFEAQSRACHVHATIKEDCVVLGDRSLLHSAIENVIRNAIRYSPAGATAEVRLESHRVHNREGILIQVSDAGEGVPEDALGKIFEPFYRIDDARVRETGGVGLGLAIAERAVRLHGGSARAVNRPEGGLLVELWLPTVDRAESSTPIKIPVDVSRG